MGVIDQSFLASTWITDGYLKMYQNNKYRQTSVKRPPIKWPPPIRRPVDRGGGGGGYLLIWAILVFSAPKGYGFSVILVINMVSILADFGHKKGMVLGL